MITFDEMGQMLDEISREVPQAFYNELNGGIQLTAEEKLHPQSHKSGDLFVLGEYHNDRKGYGGLGRYIVIYYGSFVQLYPHASDLYIRKELKRVVLHEFTHHMESLAGERGLEIKDAIELERYHKRRLLKYRRPK
jgi:hypothetical protein